MRESQDPLTVIRFNGPECWAFRGRNKEKKASGGSIKTESKLMLANSDTRNNVERANRIAVLADKSARERFEFLPKERKKTKTTSGSQVEEYLGAGGLRL